MNLNNQIRIYYIKFIFLIGYLFSSYPGNYFYDGIINYIVVNAQIKVIQVPSNHPESPSTLGKIKFDSSQLKCKTLLVLEKKESLETHSEFINQIKCKNVESEIDITIQGQNNPSIIDQSKNFAYENIIFIGTHISYLKNSLRDFVLNGGNILIVTDNTTRKIKSLLENFGISTDLKGTEISDNFSNVNQLLRNDPDYLDKLPYLSNLSCYDRNIISTNNYIMETPIIPLKNRSLTISYSGTSHDFLSNTNFDVFPLLKAMPTAMGASKSKTLISGIQTRNNGRLVFSSSMMMFSNDFFSLNPDNVIFSKYLVDWALKRSGVIKWSNLKHFSRADNKSKKIYRIEDDLSFSIDIHELKDGYWYPYKEFDVQVQYFMMSPYIRAYLTPSSDPSSPTFARNFTAPGKIGIFKFLVHYRRKGFTLIHVESIASLRELRSNEIDRFKMDRIPYYFTSVICFIGFLIFVLSLIYHSDDMEDNHIQFLSKKKNLRRDVIDVQCNSKKTD